MILALFLTTLITVALQTDWGAQLLWRTASHLASGKLSGEWVGGNLSGGLQLRNIVYKDRSTLIRVDRLESSWQLQRFPLKWSVQYIRLGTVDVTLLPGPALIHQLPEQLTLPLAIDLQSASLQHLVVRSDVNEIHFNDIRLHANYDQLTHALTLDDAVTPYGRIACALQLRAVAPFEVNGTIGLAGKNAESPYQANARLTGTLQALGLELDAKGMHLDGHASIDATPFAAVPIRRALVAIRGLDPQQFNPQWPHAKLEMRTTLSPTDDAKGDLSQLTVSGAVSLSNAQPGAINAGLLPFESATMEVVLSARKQQLRQLTIQLPGKGTLVGGGEMLVPMTGKLTLQAKGLDMHVIHDKLKPTQLNGPISVQFSGAMQEVQLELADSSLSIAEECYTSTARLRAHRVALSSMQTTRQRILHSASIAWPHRREKRTPKAYRAKIPKRECR